MNNGSHRQETGYSKNQDENLDWEIGQRKSSSNHWIAAFVASTTLLIACAIALAVVVVPKGEPTESMSVHSSEFTTAKQKVTERPSQEVCMTKQCIQAASSLLSNMDNTTDPCEDFHKFVCGNYDHHIEIPQDSAIYGKMFLMKYRVEKAVKEILEKPVVHQEFKVLSMAKNFYKSCQNQKKRHYYGRWISVKRNLAQTFGSWPMQVGEKWTAPVSFSWEKQAVRLITIGIKSILKIEVVQDPTNTKRNVIRMSASPPYKSIYNNATIASMNNRTFLKDSKNLQNMKDSMNKVPYVADSEIRKTIKEIKMNIPSVKWDIIFSIFSKNVMINNKDIVIVSSWDQFANKLNVLSKANPRDVQNYVHESFNSGILDFLPQKTDRSHILKWKECVGLTMRYFDFVLSAEYVRRYTDMKHIIMVEEMSHEIRNILTEKIHKADWLDNKTREHALAKVELMTLNVGYPKSLFNETFLLQRFNKVEIKENDFFQNNLNLTYMMVHRNLNSLRDRDRRGSFEVSQIKLNAYYMFLNNEMVFPAAILQFPALSSSVPAYVNYGRLGLIVGHEMTHGFDMAGHKHDKYGNLKNWWTKPTYKKFLLKANCFINQFNKIKDPISGFNLDGNMTLEENMADTGGLNLAYSAFMKWHSKNVPTLPGLSSYTAEQLFFIVSGNFWCEIYTPDGRLDTLFGDAHSLAKYRVNYSLKNLPAFGPSFNCPPLAKMTPEQRCEMW